MYIVSFFYFLFSPSLIKTRFILDFFNFNSGQNSNKKTKNFNNSCYKPSQNLENFN